MIEIWKEAGNFTTTSQRLADQARMILKKSWLSDVEIMEIREQLRLVE